MFDWVSVCVRCPLGGALCFKVIFLYDKRESLRRFSLTRPSRGCIVVLVIPTVTCVHFIYNIIISHLTDTLIINTFSKDYQVTYKIFSSLSCIHKKNKCYVILPCYIVLLTYECFFSFPYIYIKKESSAVVPCCLALLTHECKTKDFSLLDIQLLTGYTTFQPLSTGLGVIYLICKPCLTHCNKSPPISNLSRQQNFCLSRSK